MFYAYFFKRYLAECPATWIIMAAFSSRSKLMEVAVKKGDIYESKLGDPVNLELIRVTIEAARSKGCSLLMLCDGPPMMMRRDVQMVCFTSNEDWYKETEKEAESTWLYMPLWTFEELGTASVALDLGLDDDMLAARFDVFGGEARMCLHPYEKVLLKKEGLQTRIKEINRLEEVRQLLRSEECEKKRHRLIYYKPDELAIRYVPRIASTFVEHMLLKNALRLSEDERLGFIQVLAGVGEAGALRGYFFEARVHKVLGEGLVEINARRLDDSTRKTLTVDCSDSSGVN